MNILNHKKKLTDVLRSISILAMSLSMQSLSACMPHSPDDVFIARIQSLHINHQNQLTHFQFKQHRFIFRSITAWFRYSTPHQWKSDFEFKKLKKNDLVMGLAYTPDGTQPKNYQVSSLVLLDCHNDVLSLTQPLAPFLAWNRDGGRCGYSSNIGLLNGFLEHDQAYYLSKLQAKYPTCRKLYTAFPK